MAPRLPPAASDNGQQENEQDAFQRHKASFFRHKKPIHHKLPISIRFA